MLPSLTTSNTNQYQVKVRRSDGACLLSLPGYSYKEVRFIGYIKNNRFTTKRRLNDQLLYLNDGFGINAQFLRQYSYLFQFITIKTDTKYFRTTTKMYLEYGMLKQFGFLDSQLFLSLKYFNISSRKKTR